MNSILNFELLRKQLYSIKDSKPAKLPWLSQFEEEALQNKKYKGIFTSIHDKPCHAGLWNMIEYAMPLYLNENYHSYTIWNLVEPNIDLNFISLLCYYTMQNEILGLPLWYMISTEYFATTKINDKISLSKWKEQNDSITNDLKMTLSGKYAIQEPTEKDFCKKSSEFVECPNIQIQLPWKPVIFHQWLIAAYSDILLFELESLELRHWPIPKDIISVATNLITLLTELKHRILFGFVIFNSQIQTYHGHITDNKYPDIIMDDILLPSLPILKFIYSGQAHKILKFIKIHAWSKHEKLYFDTAAIMSTNSYLLDTYLAEFNKDFCYNYIIWNREKIQDPFPFDPDNFEHFFYRLKTKSFKTDNDFDDNIFFLEMEHNKSAITSILNATQIIDLTIKTIKDQIIDANKLPGLTESDIEKFVNTEENLALVQNEMFSDNIENPDLQIIRYAMNYNEASRLLLGCEKEKSAIAQIITLQLQIIKREVLLKTISILAFKFQITPIFKRIECFDTINPKSLESHLQNVNEEITSQNRFKLWYQFPIESKNTISLNENCPSICKGLNYIVRSFQNRLCKLVYHSAVQSFKINSNNGKPFSEWTTIQYIIPCIISSYVLEHSNFTENKVKFVHSVIKYYEEKYEEWITNSYPIQIPEIPKTCDEIMNIVTEGNIEKAEWLNLNMKLRENLRIVLGYYYHNNFYDARIIGIDQILNYLGDWPTNMTYITPSDLKYQMLKILLNWWKFSVLFQEMLLTIAVQLFNVPEPGSCDVTQHSRFSDLYLTSSILSELHVVYELASQNSNNYRLKSEIDDAINGKQQHRYDIFKTLMTLDKHTEKDIINFVNIKKKVEVNIYQKLKKFRKQSGKLEFKLIHVLPLSKLYPVIRQAVLHYINGNFDELEKMLSLFGTVKSVTNNGKICKHCGKTESGARKFLICEKCVSDKFPDVNYYCGRRCLDIRWKSEHMAEHLEFDLGLLDVNE